MACDLGIQNEIQAVCEALLYWKHLTHLWKTFFPVSSREPDRRKDGGEPGGVTCSSFNLTAELNLRKVDLGEVDLCFSRLRRLAIGEGW